MAVGLPPVTRDLLRLAPWLMAGLGMMLGLFQSMLVPEPARWWLWAALIVGGALLGLYGKYRARFAVSQGIVLCLVLVWWLAAICAGSAGMLASAAGWVASPVPAFSLVMASFLGVGAVGWWRAERPWRAAHAAGAWEAHVARYADLPRQQLALSRTPLPPTPASVAIWTAVGVNLPLVAVSLWGEAGQLGLVAGVLLFLMPVFSAIVLRMMADAVLYRHLRRYERRHGLRFASDQRETLAQVRSGLRLGRWLCRPEDRIVVPSRRRRR